MLSSEVKPLLITGATGKLGQTFARICREKKIPYILLTRKNLDICDLNSVRMILEEVGPRAVINAAGYTKFPKEEIEKEECFMTNVHGPTNLAMACREHKIPFLTFSSDLVFNDNQNTSYNEDHEISPTNVYGESKALCEEKVMAVYPRALIVRSSAFFGPWDQMNFVTQTLNRLKNKEKVIVANDVKVTPTYLPDLAQAALDLLESGASGVYHLTNKGPVSWAEFARAIAEMARDYYEIDPSLIVEKSITEIGIHQKPLVRCLTSIKGHDLPSLENALDRYFSHVHS